MLMTGSFTDWLLVCLWNTRCRNLDLKCSPGICVLKVGSSAWWHEKVSLEEVRSHGKLLFTGWVPSKETLHYPGLSTLPSYGEVKILPSSVPCQDMLPRRSNGWPIMYWNLWDRETEETFPLFKSLVLFFTVTESRLTQLVYELNVKW